MELVVGMSDSDQRVEPFAQASSAQHQLPFRRRQHYLEAELV